MWQTDDPTRQRSTAWETAVAAPPRWHERAACKGVDTDVFYPTNQAELAVAVTYCQRCPVTARCLAEAVELNDQFSVRAGLSAGERSARRRRLTVLSRRS